MTILVTERLYKHFHCMFNMHNMHLTANNSTHLFCVFVFCALTLAFCMSCFHRIKQNNTIKWRKRAFIVTFHFSLLTFWRKVLFARCQKFNAYLFYTALGCFKRINLNFGMLLRLSPFECTTVRCTCTYFCKAIWK